MIVFGFSSIGVFFFCSCFLLGVQLTDLVIIIVFNNTTLSRYLNEIALRIKNFCLSPCVSVYGQFVKFKLVYLFQPYVGVGQINNLFDKSKGGTNKQTYSEPPA